jgi:hypothetical protein
MVLASPQLTLADDDRPADEDNPRGYLEFGPVMRLRKSAAWLGEARGSAVKIVAPLLRYLPEGHAYRIVFIERDLDDVIASQHRMLERRGASVPDSPARRARLAAEYARTVKQMLTAAAARPRSALLSVSHADVMRDPVESARAINRFLGGQLSVWQMAAVVDTALHRQQATRARTVG